MNLKTRLQAGYIPCRRFARCGMKLKVYMIILAIGCFTAFELKASFLHIGKDDLLLAERAPNILVLIADDWGYPHASGLGDKVVNTPNFDRIAKQGVLFTNAFTTAPSCTPSRASLLTGRWPHQLEEGVHLKGFLPKKFSNYVEILANEGYAIGHTRKGWGPGKHQVGGYDHNPAGPKFSNFQTFFEKKPTEQPFCFWFGSYDPHRPYVKGSGAKTGKSVSDVIVPAFLPDNEVVRHDILDYYFEIERFDREVGEILDMLEASGELDNTLIVITGDNGMPFPRAKANLYDAGTHVPLAISWPARIKPGQICTAFVSFVDLAPTFLTAAGNKAPNTMVGVDLLPLMTTTDTTIKRSMVFLERERHAHAREGNIGYPSRAVRTQEFLYVKNFRSDRWPAGDPGKDGKTFADIDSSPTKDHIMIHRAIANITPFFELAFMKRPPEELYDLRVDPHQLINVANDKYYEAVIKGLRKELIQWMQKTDDPRLDNGGDYLDDYSYQ